MQFGLVYSIQLHLTDSSDLTWIVQSLLLYLVSFPLLQSEKQSLTCRLVKHQHMFTTLAHKRLRRWVFTWLTWACLHINTCTTPSLSLILCSSTQVKLLLVLSSLVMGPTRMSKFFWIMTKKRNKISNHTVAAYFESPPLKQLEDIVICAWCLRNYEFRLSLLKFNNR